MASTCAHLEQLTSSECDLIDKSFVFFDMWCNHLRQFYWSLRGYRKKKNFFFAHGQVGVIKRRDLETGIEWCKSGTCICCTVKNNAEILLEACKEISPRGN